MASLKKEVARSRIKIALKKHKRIKIEGLVYGAPRKNYLTKNK